ncbi:hypothetical protein [Nostoc sp. 'Lobaria pulmonaria (5183) cyanobiont']|nr:hypothetical protein [Nostoc sp. 'Lobaria pulmonaria (5183) cyanobiont']
MRSNQNLSNKYEFVNDAIASDTLRDAYSWLCLRILFEYKLGAIASLVL